jgi:hypothetical protein
MMTNILINLWPHHLGLSVIHLNKLKVKTSRRKLLLFMCAQRNEVEKSLNGWTCMAGRCSYDGALRKSYTDLME